MEQSLIKGIVVSNCPHCAKEIFLELQSTAPAITAVLAEEQVNLAKDEVLKILDSRLTVAQFEAACNVIKDKTYLFGPNDVQNIVDQFVGENSPVLNIKE